ncbi:MAG: NAD(P)-binding protein [Bdellovibrionales bacterium]
MKIPKKVEYLVVGGGLVGLSIFEKLQAEGKDSILIEKSGELGGSLMRPDSEGAFSLESLIWTQEKNLNLFKYDTKFSETLCIGKKGLMPFMGFGEEKVPALEAIDIFASNETQIVTSFQNPSLSENLIKRSFLHTQVTSLSKTSEDGDYNLFELNGKNFIEAEKIIWTAPVQELDEVLPKEEFGALRQKIKKSKHFDVITAKFEVSKEELGEFQNNKFIFMGEEQTPWLGCSITDNQMTFISFYDSALTSDHDFIRKHLKTLKRRLHKAFSEAFDEEITKGSSKEKITLHRSAISSFNPSKKDWCLKDLSNLYLLSSHKSFWPHPLEEKLKFLQPDASL